jgi:hypothetical protein
MDFIYYFLAICDNKLTLIVISSLIYTLYSILTRITCLKCLF